MGVRNIKYIYKGVGYASTGPNRGEVHKIYIKKGEIYVKGIDGGQ